MKVLSYEYVKERIEKEGYKLLSKEYKNAHDKLELICLNGHNFMISWNKFNKEQRCKICSNKINGEKRKHSYEFVKEQIEKEGYKLLSKKYINSVSKLRVKCNKGHEYKVTYAMFNSGCRCKKCFYEKRKHSYEFIKEQIEKEGYKLLSKEYNRIDKKLKLECNKGHGYKTTFNAFKSGQRCPICNNEKKGDYSRLLYEFVKEQYEKIGYELLSKEYINSKNKLEIKCDKGHEYISTWETFKHGCRCPKCCNVTSNTEKEIVEYIKSLNIHVIENDRSIIHPFELDIVIPEKKIAIEYCGLYWHSEKYLDKNYHVNKLKLTNEAGYRLITIFEDEWINKKDIVKNRLKYFLNLNTKKIYARKCNIKEITKEQSREFINKYHIQGYVNASLCIGAFYNDELVAVNTFIKINNIYELNRFCTSCNIVGIASKLIKYFQRNYEWKEIITFADLRWSEGYLYEKIGFEKDKVLKPDYSYCKNGLYRYHKFGFRHSGMKNKLKNYNPELSEHENMLNNNYYRIYDCGKIKYIMKSLLLKNNHS